MVISNKCPRTFDSFFLIICDICINEKFEMMKLNEQFLSLVLDFLIDETIVFS